MKPTNASETHPAPHTKQQVLSKAPLTVCLNTVSTLQITLSTGTCTGMYGRPKSSNLQRKDKPPRAPDPISRATFFTPRGEKKSKNDVVVVVPGYLLRRGRLVLLSTSPGQVEKMRETLVFKLILSIICIKHMRIYTDLV